MKQTILHTLFDISYSVLKQTTIQIFIINNILSMKYITQEGLVQLKNYKYKPGEYTWLDIKMNRFWEFCVSLVPMWVAPNMLTFIGWLFVIASYTNMLRYDYTFTKDLPSSAFWFAGSCIFIYSTLDAIDGKQARRTKTSSPLGQLFDHGCDSFSLTFFILAICQATRLKTQQVFLIFISSQTSFWVSNWAQYNTGVLRTKVGQFGVTQAQYTLVLMHFATAFFGQTLWDIKVSSLIPFTIETTNQAVKRFLDSQMSTVTVYFYGSMIILMNIYVIIRTILKSDNLKRTTLQNFSFLLLITMELSWSYMRVYNKYAGFILMNFGIIASLLISKLIICSVTKMKFSYFHLELLPLMFCSIALVVLNYTNAPISLLSIVFYLCFVANLIVVFNFLYNTIQQITKYLGIYCFSITKRRSD